MRSAFVITGYLGSGKTTLILNAVKEHLKDKKVAVVVNEFGEVGLDGKILSRSFSQVLELPEGCICCRLTAEFEKGVRELVETYDPEVLVVETSGTAEPFPIVFSLKTMGFMVDGVLCVVDSKNFPKYKEEETAKYQLAGSNVVVLNKADLVSEEELKRVKEAVREIKEKYKVVNLFSPEEDKSFYKVYEAVRGKVPAEVFAGAGSPLKLKALPSLRRHHESRCTEVIKLKEDLPEEELKKILEGLREEGVVRAKGVAKIKDFPYPTFVHYVFGDYDYLNPAEGYKGDYFLVVIK
ncbi:MAG: GTP-binding protein [Aquificae bacterium]|nr:GTP-binding protein [Aquificota bacterium]